MLRVDRPVMNRLIPMTRNATRASRLHAQQSCRLVTSPPNGSRVGGGEVIPAAGLLLCTRLTHY